MRIGHLGHSPTPQAGEVTSIIYSNILNFLGDYITTLQDTSEDKQVFNQSFGEIQNIMFRKSPKKVKITKQEKHISKLGKIELFTKYLYNQVQCKNENKVYKINNFRKKKIIFQ